MLKLINHSIHVTHKSWLVDTEGKSLQRRRQLLYLVTLLLVLFPLAEYGTGIGNRTC